MKTKIKKATVAFLLFLSLIYSVCLPISAVELPDISGAQSVYLWNEEHDKIIVSSSNTEVIFPASMTKMMTGLVAIDLIGDRLYESVTITSDMIRGAQGTSMQLRTGQTITYEELLYGTICSGFNDATMALAVSSAGSVGGFVAKMNEKAKALGAKSTRYTNPTGWHDDNMVTTLADTVLIAKAAMNNELYVKISSATSYTVKSQGVTINNRNGLISSFYSLGNHNQRAKGLIAGMTDEGGHCVATFFEDSSLTYLCIVMGATSEGDTINSYKIANSLISYIVYYYGELKVIKQGQTLAKAPVNLATATSDDDIYMLPCTVQNDVTIVTPYDKSSLDNIEFKTYFFSDELTAPIKEGEIIGGVDIFVDGVLRGNAKLCASEDVEANGFLVAMNGAKKMLLGRRFIVFFIVFIILFSVYFIFFELKALRKKSSQIKFDRIY